MKVFTLLLLFAIGAASSEAATKTKSKSTPKPSSLKSSSRKSTKKPVARAPRVVTQQQPTSDRYREIQQALISKGFLDGEPTGQWDSQSVAAFKKFEQSQNLREDGKIDSMALIALGLGPARTQTASVAQ